MECPKCGYELPERGDRCLFCGAIVGTDARARGRLSRRTPACLFIALGAGVVLLIVLVVLSLGKMATRQRALCERNLRVIALAERSFFSGVGRYTTSMDELREFVQSPAREPTTREYSRALDPSCPTTHEPYTFETDLSRSALTVSCPKHDISATLLDGGPARYSWENDAENR
jgi:hypothetical protein